MNANKTNTGMNVEDYENMAVQNSNVAKRVAVGSAVFLGGAAVAGGAAYAANHSETSDAPLTEDDLLSGAEVGSGYTPVEETASATTTTERVVVEKPVAATESEDEANPEITWDETSNFYAGDDKVMSIEQGTVDGHKFALVDMDGDEHADYLMVDMNDNGQFDEGEVIKYTPSDHVHMGHSTAHVTDHHYGTFGNDGSNDVAQNNSGVHNDFEDEKTGEYYHGDFAENNPDYNSRASLEGMDGKGSLAENAQDPTGDMGEIHNDANDLAQNDPYDGDVNSEVDEGAEETDAYDSMMGGDEFLA